MNINSISSKFEPFSLVNDSIDVRRLFEESYDENFELLGFASDGTAVVDKGSAASSPSSAMDTMNEIMESKESLFNAVVSTGSTLPFLGKTPGSIDDITPKEREVFTDKFKKVVIDVRNICDISHKKFNAERPRTHISTQGKIFTYDTLEPCVKSKSMAEVKINVISSKKHLSCENLEPIEDQEREQDSEASGDVKDIEMTPHVLDTETSELDDTPSILDIQTPDTSISSDSLNPEAPSFSPGERVTVL